MLFVELLQRKKMAQEKRGSDAEFEQKKMTLGITVDIREQDGNKENMRRDVRDLRNKLIRKERVLSQDDQIRRGREVDTRSRPSDEYRSTKVDELFQTIIDFMIILIELVTYHSLFI